MAGTWTAQEGEEGEEGARNQGEEGKEGEEGPPSLALSVLSSASALACSSRQADDGEKKEPRGCKLLRAPPRERGPRATRLLKLVRAAPIVRERGEGRV